MLRLVVTAALPLWVALAPIADAAEPSNRIWDPDLKRYLTGEDIGKVLVYRESKGSEVRMKRFNSQYEGKTVLDPIRINKDIINITGATMSVRSVSAGVKRALVLIDEFYLKPR